MLDFRVARRRHDSAENGGCRKERKHKARRGSCVAVTRRGPWQPSGSLKMFSYQSRTPNLYLSEHRVVLRYRDFGLLQLKPLKPTQETGWIVSLTNIASTLAKSLQKSSSKLLCHPQWVAIWRRLEEGVGSFSVTDLKLNQLSDRRHPPVPTIVALSACVVPQIPGGRGSAEVLGPEMGSKTEKAPAQCITLVLATFFTLMSKASGPT